MQLLEFAIVFAISFIVTFVMTPVSKRIAYLLGAIDYPGNRRINTSPVPRCGGIALYCGILAGMTTAFVGVRFFDWELLNLYRLADVDYLLLYVGVTTMFAVGLVDDVVQLSSWVKFAGQVASALIIVLAGISIGAVRMVITGDYIDLDWLDYPLSVLYLVVFVNVINLIDGLDGLASGVVAIVCSGLLFLVMIRGNMTLAFVCTAVIAVCLAFLRYNFFPASIFMGDSGSMLLGLAVGIISVVGVARMDSFVIMLVPLAIAGVPVLDTFSAIVRRLRGHQSVGQGDLNHLHHRLMRTGLGQKRTVAVLWVCSAALSFAGIAISSFSGPVRWLVFIILFMAIFVVVWYFGLFNPVLKHHYDNRGQTGVREEQKRGKSHE